MNLPQNGEYEGVIDEFDFPEENLNCSCAMCKYFEEKKISSLNIRKEKRLVVLGGGVQNKEDIEIFFDAEIACSRKLVERGWFTVERQIGLSGNLVHADCLITISVSGSVQFQAEI